MGTLRKDSRLGRRELMLGMASLGVAGQALLRAAPAAGQSAPFGPGTVEAIARSLARKPFNPPDRSLPPAIANLDYDQYRSIRFARSRSEERRVGKECVSTCRSRLVPV